MQKQHQSNKHTWLKTGKEIIGLQIKEVPTLVTPFMPVIGVMSLAGSSDIGKSYLLLQLASAVVQGQDNFLGFPLHATHRSVIYISTEDDDYSLSPRLVNLSKNCRNTESFDNLRIITETSSLLERIENLLQEQRADVVIIDTFLDVYSDDMNQANQVRGFIQKYREIANKYSTLIIFNHHCGKKNDYKEPHKDNLLGSQGFESSMRTVLELRADFSDPHIRHLCIVKGNYIDGQHKGSSYVLRYDFENGFANTGQRVEFKRLAKQVDTAEKRSGLINTVISLREQGMSIREIEKQIKKDGLKAGHTTISGIIKHHCPTDQSVIDEGTDGQDAAA